MTDAQTEARAIAQKLQDVVDGTDGWLNVDKAAGIIATALAEKDVEMAKLELERDKWEQHACTGDDVLARTRSKLERAEARLAEARKALDQRDADIAEFMGRLGSRWFLEQGWFPASVGARVDDAKPGGGELTPW